MKTTFKKALSFILVMAIVITVGAVGISAQTTALADEADTNPVKVTAKADSPISITKTEEFDDVYDGILALSVEKYNIKHDYSQICKVSVINNGEKTVEYYLVVENDYEDLSMNFIKSGSKESPFIIQPGETQEVELAVFAQNAEKTEYKLPIYAYVIEDDWDYCDAANVVDITCESVSVSFSKNFSCISGSRPPVGSSRISSLGVCIIAAMMESLRRFPMESSRNFLDVSSWKYSASSCQQPFLMPRSLQA